MRDLSGLLVETPEMQKLSGPKKGPKMARMLNSKGEIVEYYYAALSDVMTGEVQGGDDSVLVMMSIKDIGMYFMLTPDEADRYAEGFRAAAASLRAELAKKELKP